MSEFCKALFFAGVQVDRYTGHSSRIGGKKDSRQHDENLGLVDQQGIMREQLASVTAMLAL